MYRNRKTAAILVVAAALVLALIFAVGHGRAATDNGSNDQTTATSDGASSAGNGANANLAVNGGEKLGKPHSSGASGASGSNQTGNGNGSTTTTPPTTTPPGGGGHKPPFRPPVGQVGGNAGVLDPGTPPPTTTPPNHNPVNDPGGTGCIHKPGFACP
jgi:hypothetical protein